MASVVQKPSAANPEPITPGEGGFGQTCDLPSGRRYTELAQHLHWLTAVLAAAILPVAWVMTSLPEHSPRQPFLYDLHKSLGLTIWLLIVFRLFWRFTHPAPALGPHTPAWMNVASKASHWLLYLAFFAMPISGTVMSEAGGHAVRFWGLPLPAFPKNEAVAQIAMRLHNTGQWAVYGLLVLHIVAAAYHVAIRRDGGFQRMTPPQTRSDPA